MESHIRTIYSHLQCQSIYVLKLLAHDNTHCESAEMGLGKYLQAMYFEQFNLFLHELNNKILVNLL